MEHIRGNCDRCSNPVRLSEDCVHFEETLHYVIHGVTRFCGFKTPRHLRCSPSRMLLIKSSADARLAVDVMAMAEAAMDEYDIMSDVVRKVLPR